MALTTNGKIKKKAYCPNCFSILEWDDPKDEISVNGHRAVICPECGAKVDICVPFKVTIEDAEAEEKTE